MSDLISRKDAIDAVKHAWAKGLEPSQYIEELPSVQPEVLACGDGNLTAQPCDDAISRAEAIEAFDKEIWSNIDIPICKGIRSAVKKTIEQIPSVQPEIVRCKDCKHRIEHKHYGDLGESAYTCEGNMAGWILPDGFCSYAERRTDEPD